MGWVQLLLLLTLLMTPMTFGSPLEVVMGDPPPPLILGPRPISVGHLLSGGGGLRPHCRPINVTVALEKDQCPQCRAVPATACGGFCRTREPVYRSPLGAPPQSVCTYTGVRYERWVLGGCPPGTDPTVSVPVPVGCRCGRCPMATADCSVAALGPSFCGASGGFGGQ